MTNEQAFKIGFLKRAAELGVSEETKALLVKRAEEHITKIAENAYSEAHPLAAIPGLGGFFSGLARPVEGFNPLSSGAIEGLSSAAGGLLGGAGAKSFITSIGDDMVDEAYSALPKPRPMFYPSPSKEKLFEIGRRALGKSAPYIGLGAVGLGSLTGSQLWRSLYNHFNNPQE